MNTVDYGQGHGQRRSSRTKPALVPYAVEWKHEAETVTEFWKCYEKPLPGFVQNDEANV